MSSVEILQATDDNLSYKVKLRSYSEILLQIYTIAILLNNKRLNKYEFLFKPRVRQNHARIVTL